MLTIPLAAAVPITAIDLQQIIIIPQNAMTTTQLNVIHKIVQRVQN